MADVGAGDGYFTFRLADAVGEKGKVLATDIDAKALKRVEDRARRDRRANVQTVVSEPTHTKLDDASLDAAFMCDVIHHVPKDQRLPLVKDIARALKPGGFFFLIDWREKADVSCDRDRRIPLEDLIKVGTDAGLVLDAEFHYLKWQVFLRFRKPE